MNESLDARLITQATAALEMLSISLGRRLGLYEALISGATTSAGLAGKAGIHPRYAREWLEQQAVAGFITVDDPSAPADERKYGLTDEQIAVFTEPENPSYVSSLADMVGGVGQVMESLIDAYRTGGGVAFSDYGAALRDGQGAINRPAFTHDLVPNWIGAMPDIADRLHRGGRAADLGCGVGWSTIALARAGIDVVGYDLDAASIKDARRNAEQSGVTPRLVQGDAEQVASDGPFDLVLLLEALHDVAHPVEILAAARRALGPDGAMLIADELVADSFTAPGDELERMMYGWSVLHCLPAAMGEEGTAATGTVLRAAQLGEYAKAAGFSSVEVLPVDAGFFRLYRLNP